MLLENEPLQYQGSLGGLEVLKALSLLVDAWLIELMDKWRSIS